MFRYATFAIAIVSMLLAVGCGENKPVAVSPTTADAQNYPGGIVPFTATGISNATWCIGSASGMCNGNIAAAATIDATGRAQCLSGGSGTVTVLAGTAGMVNNPDGGFQLSRFGSAQLTCP